MSIIGKLTTMKQLRELSNIARDLFYREQTLSFSQVQEYFDLIGYVFGDDEASGFLNLCLKTLRKNTKEATSGSIESFLFAVTETISAGLPAAEAKFKVLGWSQNHD